MGRRGSHSRLCLCDVLWGLSLMLVVVLTPGRGRLSLRGRQRFARTDARAARRKRGLSRRIGAERGLAFGCVTDWNCGARSLLHSNTPTNIKHPVFDTLRIRQTIGNVRPRVRQTLHRSTQPLKTFVRACYLGAHARLGLGVENIGD